MDQRPWQCPPLTDHKRYIRLLSMEHTQDCKAPISCSIDEYNINDPPEYCALSYVCGNRHDQSTVFISGKAVSTYASLEAGLRRALKALSSDEDSILLWADALCIDQENRVEKAAQVTLMASIYRKAKSVHVWLGDHARNDKGWGYSQQERVSQILRSPWRSRLWCYQELYLAKSGLFLYGDFAWDIRQVVGEISDLLHKSCHDGKVGLWSPELSIGTKQMFDMLHFFFSYNRRGRFRSGSHEAEVTNDLLDILILMRTTNCSDPRDKIFASLSMSKDLSLADQNLPSYAMTTKSVFLRLAKTLMENSKKLDILNYCVGGDRSPSWVPDWRRAEYRTQAGHAWKFLRSPARPDDIPVFQASADTFAHYKLQEGSSGKGQSALLYAAGFVVDAIHVLGSRATTENLDGPVSMEFPIVQEWYNLVQHRHGEVSADMKNRFWLTLLADSLYCNYDREHPRQKHLGHLRDTIASYVQDEHFKYPSHGFLEVMLRDSIAGGQFWLTKSGKMGMSWNAYLQPGYQICILFGGATPYIVEEIDQNTHRFVQQCYVDGIMYGEAMKDFVAAKYEGKEFCFI